MLKYEISSRYVLISWRSIRFYKVDWLKTHHWLETERVRVDSDIKEAVGTNASEEVDWVHRVDGIEWRMQTNINGEAPCNSRDIDDKWWTRRCSCGTKKMMLFHANATIHVLGAWGQTPVCEGSPTEKENEQQWEILRRDLEHKLVNLLT